MIDAGDQPLGVVLRELKNLENGQIYGLITPLESAPLIDKAQKERFAVWVKTISQTEYHTFFASMQSTCPTQDNQQAK